MFGPNICSGKYLYTPKHLILLLVIIIHVMYFEIIVIYMMATDYLQMCSPGINTIIKYSG